MYIPSGITVSVGHTRFQPWMKPPACESTDKFGNKIYFSDGVTKMNWHRLTVGCNLSFNSLVLFNFPHFGEKFEEMIRHFLHSVSQ